MPKYSGPLDRTYKNYLWHDVDGGLVHHYIIRKRGEAEYRSLCGQIIPKEQIQKSVLKRMCPTCRQVQMTETAKYQATLPALKIRFAKPQEYYLGTSTVKDDNK